MKKIMFNDRYGLTEAVLRGRKTMTRRIIPDGTPLGNWAETEKKLPYKEGDIVAIAQRYSTILEELEDPKNYSCMEQWESDEVKRLGYALLADTPGFSNKMFVKAEDMPHRIKIESVRLERLQDISDEDILKEGVFIDEDGDIDGNKYAIDVHTKHTNRWWFPNARLAYATLIDWISGKGTWQSNPLAAVYTFKLVK